MMVKKNLSNVNKIAISGIVIAMYVIIMYFTQSFAFMQFQIRIATALYSLSAIFPFLIIPMGISNLISNTLMGGLGIPDMVGGALVGMITSFLVYLISKYKLNDWFIVIPIILIPGFGVPIWLSYLLHIKYIILASSLSIGQIIPAIVGVLLVKQLRKFY
ncbi:putative membrane protein [Clostridium algifaecis]|uniref:Membrane protein n=1 Tax=Clostridium algifaecis TaxID=1472040 RepID=A0ABS4KPM3_9CLOT|nr:QueT transporter family protein [Clostridium algifaecis]MBP2031996.1 putative membrane protein [Clostridium algifaecis]